MIPGFTLTTDPHSIDVDALHALLRRSHWARNRSRETVAKSLEHSLCYGIHQGAQLVAFARVVTDHCTFAYLCDVFVDEAFRGQGLSKWLMSEIIRHPDLGSLRRFVLATKDAHSLYSRYGFAPLNEEENRRFMSILKEDA